MDKLLMRKLREEKNLLLDPLARIDMPQLQNKKVMVIDDCEDTLRIVKKYLTDVNRVSVATFLDEFQAIRDFMKDKADLVILDMNLNSLDGIKVSSVFDNLSSLKVPIIFISRDTCSQKDLENLYDNDKASFVPKPIKKEVLLAKVKQALIAA